MGAVKSRNITTADVEADDQQHHPQHSSHSMLRNGHHNHNGPASGGGTLQKQDLRYDIGSSAEYHHIRQPSVRSRSQQPMPTTDELDRRFAKVLASMDLPPDKAKLLRNYDDEKKWDMICDQEMVQAKDPPSHYLSRLRTYLDPKASRSHRKRKMVGESTSTQVLRDLEISLRTNHIEWVKEFLDDSNQGLDALVDYLSFRLQMMQHEQRLQGALCASEERLNLTSGGDGVEMVLSQNSSLSPPQSQPHAHTHNGGLGNGSFLLLDSSRQQHVSYGFLRPTIADALDSPSLKRRSRHIAKLNMGAATDDIHVSIMCLRAIMNNKYGFNMVIQHREAINCIALSLIHKSLRTKALVLELLAAICLVKGGHEIILGSFDNFKDVCQEQRRFQTLMEYFMNFEAFNIDFMVACMQFMNIVVHSVEDMNYRVHLQYEFTALGLDKYLERIRLTESEELKVQISAYLDNVFDVAALMEDSETKTSALERVQELDDQLEREIDRNSEFLYKFAELETENINLKTERDQLTVARQNLEEELTALQRMLQQNEQELQKRDTLLRTKNQELQTLSRSLPRSASSGDGCLTNGGLQAGATSGSDSPLPPPLPLPMTTAAAAPPPPPPPAPPAPPPPPMMPGMGLSPLGSPNGSIASTAPSPPLAQPMLSSFPPPPPPVAGFMPAPDGAMTIKRKVPTKYKLPTLNWIPLKPNQVRGTIFNELDDEKIFKQIDFNEFEERFKIGSIGGALLNGTTGSEVDGSLQSSKRFKRPDNVSLLEHTRLRNIAISRRKLGMPIDDVVAAIQGLDLKKLSLENVELLQKMVPTDVEIKAYKEYIIARKDPQLLTEEDRFMLQLSRVERISFKLSIMNYMGNFIDSVHLISPQVQSIAGASNSLKQSRKFRAVLEIVLAFGNYLNSNKRGPAYGFKLQSLDTLIDTKSTDKRSSLLHYIVATIRAKFPELLNYETELQCTDKAALVALENVVADVHELDKGMDQVRKEAELRVKGTQTHILRDFLNNTEDKLKKIKSDLRHAQEAFKECVEYFGESSRTADAAAFFSLIVRFTRAFKQHDQENEQRRRLEQAAALAASKKENNAQVLMRNKHNQKKQQLATTCALSLQDAVINELKTKAHSVREKKLLQQDEVYNGALEDILLGLKSEPYRRADAVRRSQRRRIDNNRLSRTLEEMDC
ncbi:formin-like protein isoform X4 [Drosophila guanche]|uniref:Blast:Formin-like protein CG32138 n=1 Tax=Drosophila guanche TaxID=7266 RepID=A0A3B0J3Z9_DROGU|nr:formin-like protein isoform X4 [Drosophila guanche]SPP76105.1 blast:Formin-like protein CG32138 [Drosophila guanche]